MKSLGLSAVLILLFSSLASAATLSWDDCVQLVIRNNPALESAWQNSLSSQETTRSTRGNYLPQLSGSAGYTHSISSLTPSSPSYISDNYSTSLNLSQNIFNGLSDLAKVEQSQANEGIAQANFQTVKAQVSYNLKSSFEGLHFSQASIALTEAITARRDQNLRLVELRFKDGRENRGSVLLYQAYLKDSKYSELQARDNLEGAKSQLAQALGIDDSSSLSITGAVPIHEPGNLNLLDAALKTPTYIQSYYQEKSADAGITLARSGFFPTLTLSGATGRSGPTWFPENDRWSVGLSLNVPIFNGGRDYYATRAALDAEKSATATLHDVIHQTVYQLTNARFNFIEAVEKLNVDSSYLEAAQVRAEIARANYKNGLTSFQDWDLAETDLINRETNLLSSEKNRVVAEAAWEQAQGKGVIP